jgi:hypothetical protein
VQALRRGKVERWAFYAVGARQLIDHELAAGADCDLVEAELHGALEAYEQGFIFRFVAGSIAEIAKHL